MDISEEKLKQNSAQRQGDRQQLGREDWEHAALQMLAERGLVGLAIEPLARRLGVTKGSFYWHFSDRRELLHAALLRWEQTDQHNLDALLSVDLPAAEKLAAFFRANSRQHRTHEVYAALISSAGQQAEQSWVADLLNKVDKRRIDYLIRAYMELDAETAEFRARLAYYAYVGFLQMQSRGAWPINTDGGEYEPDYLDYLINTLVK